MRLEYPAKDEAARQMLDIGQRMVNGGYVVANDGNLTCRIGENEILATPTGVSKGCMQVDMLSVLDLDGNVVEEGRLPVSSEIRMHLRVYRENDSLNAVVHAHPIVATSFAAAGIALDESILTEAVTAIGSIPVAHFAVPGTSDVPDSIAPFCTQYNGALLANHGAIAWAEQLELAFFRMQWIEVLAKATLITKYILGQYNTLSETQVAAFMPMRDKLGISLGGYPIFQKNASNDTDVLPRSGLVTEVCPTADQIEDIVRRVTANVLSELRRQEPDDQDQGMTNSTN